MGLVFRKSKALGPLRLTVSKRGLSASAGVPGARVSANTRGEVRRTVGIPGSGLYDVKRLDGSPPQAAAPVVDDDHAARQQAELAAARDGARAEFAKLGQITASNKALRAERKRRMSEATTRQEKAAVREWFRAANRDLNRR